MRSAAKPRRAEAAFRIGDSCAEPRACERRSATGDGRRRHCGGISERVSDGVSRSEQASVSATTFACMRCLRSKYGRGLSPKARTAYTLLADVNKFASDSEHYSGKFIKFYALGLLSLFQDQRSNTYHDCQHHLLRHLQK